MSGAAKRRRGSMGDYITPQGGRPLSAQYLPTPGPSDYNLQEVASVGKDAPRSSMHTRLYPLKIPPQPGPGEYDIGTDALWDKDKSVSLTPKRTTWPYDTKKDAHITLGHGSARYNLRTRPAGPKRTLSARHREGLHAGHPNALIQPVDTLGFATPGPPLDRPGSIRGAKHSIATRLPGKSEETLGPGPAGYSLPRPVPPAPLIGETLMPLQQPEYPAPNAYTLRESPMEGKTFGLKCEPPSREGAPPPNRYNLRKNRAQSAHFTLRPFPWKSEQRPSPADYTLGSADHERMPEYSVREKCLPVFPDILLYPEHEVTMKPGVGEYSPDRDFADNYNPAYSVGLPLPIKPNSNPGPNKYNVDYTHLSTLPTQPSYSMRPKISGVSKEPSPGPGEYTPQGEASKAVSITPRRKALKPYENPSPNSYTVSPGLTRKGASKPKSASMKSRPTPVLYNGFSNSAMVRLQTMS